LRIVNPSSDLLILKSMEKYGQLSPVVVSERYELIDGFKRLRAAFKLNKKQIKGRILTIGPQASKAAIVQLNCASKSINYLEEALVVHSLYRENGLTQYEIGTLLNHHKSWVSRRITLVEQLSDEVKESIRVGLIRVSIGWGLAKLQRCNQEKVMKVIEKNRFTVRQADQLICTLLSRPQSEHDAILRCPKQNIHYSYSGKDNRLSEAGTALFRKLRSMHDGCLSVMARMSLEGLSKLTESDLFCLSSLIGESIRSANAAVDTLKKTLVMAHPKESQEKEAPNRRAR
jgi:ParB/RepB/Spo0J family partition protein